MLKNKKGQALVEFIVIAPVFLMLIFCLVDFGRIFYIKSDLESEMSDIVTMHYNQFENDEIKEFIKKNHNGSSISITNLNDNDLSFEITKPVKIFTPGLNLVLGNPYVVSVKRVIPNE